MRVKVCGITLEEDGQALSASGADMVGFIFYPKSPRRVRVPIKTSALKRVGVFVNETKSEILRACEKHDLDMVQLHGQESVGLCEGVKAEGLGVIKAFGVHEHFDFPTTEDFTQVCDYFLFDTHGVGHGGTGRKFPWTVLKQYEGSTPYLLSGGIKPGDEDRIHAIAGRDSRMVGVDINSGFEQEPGVKKMTEVHTFIKNMKS